MINLESIEKLPNWLRWILLLPIASITYLLINVIIILLNEFTLPNSVTNSIIYNIWLRIAADGIATYSFVWLGAKIAPKIDFVISIILSVLIIIGSFLAITLGYEISLSTIEILFSILATIVGSLAAVFSIKNG
jgi:hypothetical protein